MDERNPENSMPYFPMEQEWFQMVRLSWILMDERFPGRYTVNSLPLYGTRQPDAGPRKLRGRSNTPPQNAARQGSRPTEKAEHSYPNTILVDWDSSQPASRSDNFMAPDSLECPNWVEEIADQFIREVTNDVQATLGAGQQD